MILPRKRQGVTLVEMMAAMATLTIVLALCAAMVMMLLRVSTSGGDHMADEAVIARAARLFRADVREAVAFRAGGPEDAASDLALDFGDGSGVDYAIARDSLIRVVHAGDFPITQDVIDLPKGSSPRFAVGAPDLRGHMGLLLNRSARSPAGAIVREMRIEAILGSNHRFEDSSEDSP